MVLNAPSNASVVKGVMTVSMAKGHVTLATTISLVKIVSLVIARMVESAMMAIIMMVHVHAAMRLAAMIVVSAALAIQAIQTVNG